VGPRIAVAACLALALAAIVVACGDDETSSGVEALTAASCGELEYEGSGDPDVLIASDLPAQGASAERTEQMNEAIRLELEAEDWKAGDLGVAFQACDDSLESTGEWDTQRCRDNASAYADNPDVVAVIGTYNSGCAAEIMPILNEAPGGGVAMISPGNTFVCLTEPSEDLCDPDQPDSYFPTGSRNYVRVVPNDAAQGAGLAEFAAAQGIERPFILYAADDPTSLGQADTFRGAAEAAGLRIAGAESWDPEAADYTDLMEKAGTGGADAVLLAGLLEQNGPQLIEDKVAVLGPNDGDVKLLAPDGFAQQATIDDTGEASEGMFVSVPARAPDALPDAGASLVEDLQAQIGDVPVEVYAPYAGQAAQLALEAITEGTSDRKAVIENMYETEISDGIVGDFTIEESGDPSLKPITISVAGPDEFRTEAEIVPSPELVTAARG
jgi:branched-chain amino acid transport system substrate-binding protein